jgi:hypothetical protein
MLSSCTGSGGGVKPFRCEKDQGRGDTAVNAIGARVYSAAAIAAARMQNRHHSTVGVARFLRLRSHTRSK